MPSATEGEEAHGMLEAWASSSDDDDDEDIKDEDKDLTVLQDIPNAPQRSDEAVGPSGAGRSASATDEGTA